jgi:carbon-monoxide dehydrogenase medium subunit
VKPASFAYHRPGTVDEALALLAALGPEARPLAGGQSLIPAMNFRLARPAALVDLNRIGALTHITEDAESLRIGAMTRQRAAERDAAVRRAAPLLAEALPHVAHAQIRGRGTIGGSVAHADPAAEIPAVLLALGARFVLRGPRGERVVPADEFFTGLFETALAPGELLVETVVPRMPPRAGWGFVEMARRHGDYALVGVAALVALDEAGRCRDARVVLFGVGAGPVLARRAVKSLSGAAPSEKVMTEAADAAAAKDADPPGDIHASAAYRRQLVRVLTRRALERAAARAREAP